MKDNSPEFVNELVPSFPQSSIPVNHASSAGIGDDFTVETASSASMWPTIFPGQEFSEKLGVFSPTILACFFVFSRICITT